MKITRKHQRHLSRRHNIAQGVIRGAVARHADESWDVAIAEVRGSMSKAKKRARIEAALTAISDTITQVCNRRSIRRSRRGAEPVTLTRQQRMNKQVWRYIRAAVEYWPGDIYSGKTTRRFTAVARGTGRSETATWVGEQYGGKSTYYQTNACHYIEASIEDIAAVRRAGLPASVDTAIIVRAKQVRACVYEIATIEKNNKQIVSQTRHLADQGGGQWHLAKTERGAVTALNRSRRADEASRQARVNGAICRRWGWCAAGIRQWCAAHGIRRDIARRIQRGAHSAALARLIQRHGGPKTGYERRIVMAAS